MIGTFDMHDFCACSASKSRGICPCTPTGRATHAPRPAFPPPRPPHPPPPRATRRRRPARARRAVRPPRPRRRVPLGDRVAVRLVGRGGGLRRLRPLRALHGGGERLH